MTFRMTERPARRKLLNMRLLNDRRAEITYEKGELEADVSDRFS